MCMYVSTYTHTRRYQYTCIHLSYFLSEHSDLWTGELKLELNENQLPCDLGAFWMVFPPFSKPKTLNPELLTLNLKLELD